MHINGMETHAVITRTYNLRDQLTGTKILLDIDNIAMLFSMYKKIGQAVLDGWNSFKDSF